MKNLQNPPILWSRLNRLRFGQLRLIAELDKNSSIRQTATAINLSQPAVSKGLKELESMLGVALYRRTVQGVQPTLAGITAARGARLLLSELELLVNEARQAESTEKISVRLGISPYLGASLLPNILARLALETEIGSINLEENWTPNLLEKLAQGSLDMLLIMCSPDMVMTLGNSSLTYEILCSEHLAVIAPTDHALAGLPSITLDQLADESWIFGETPSQTRQTINEAFLHAGIKPPTPFMTATSAYTLVSSVAAGLGITGLPVKSVQASVAAGQTVMLDLVPQIALPPIVIVYRRLLTEYPRLTMLVEALRREFTRSAI